MADKVFHIPQMRTVGAEVIFYGLFIAYINEELAEFSSVKSMTFR